jgi:hypothetical protein
MPVLKISHGDRSAKMTDYLFSQGAESGRLQALGGNVVGRDPVTVEHEFQETRDFYGYAGGRQYYHVALSFERADLGDMTTPDGAPDYGRIRDYGEEWAKETGIADKYEYLVVVHGEKDHPHAHVVWNATGLDGRKYHDDKHNLDRLRDVNDRLARSHGIQRELDRVRDPHRPSDRFIRQAERGGGRYSWKLDMQDRIREAGRRAFSEEEFRRRLKEKGVELRIRGEKYSFGMTDAHGKHRAIREGRLGEPYQRAHLVVKFGQQKEQLRRDPEGYRRRLKEEQAGRYSWQRDLRGRIIETLRTAKNHEAFAEALGRQGVSARLGEDGLYRFSFRDRHGLEHRDVSAERLYRGTNDRISTRLQENADSGAIGERAQVVSVTHTVGREAGGLVATLMRQMESSCRDQRGRGPEGLPTREDLRQERPRRQQGLEDWQERW